MALPLVLCFCEVQAGLAKDAGEAVQMLGCMSAVLDALVRGLWILKWCLKRCQFEYFCVLGGAVLFCRSCGQDTN